MRSTRPLLRAALLLLLSAAHAPLLVSAGQSVNVGLQATFDSPPYLIELLESATDEKPSVYFPLLDRIAAGYFQDATTDKELYERFLQLLKDDDLLTDPQSLSSFQLALSIRNSAPRIEAHYQYYKTSIVPRLDGSQGVGCEAWVEFAGKQFCSPQFENENTAIKRLRGDESHKLPFDRLLGSPKSLPAVVYADISSPTFHKFHQTISKAAKDGKVSYRVRYKPPVGRSGEPLSVSGYGVQLALKRTDYIVIDDRQAEGAKEEVAIKAGENDAADEEVDDLRPLSSSELEELDLKASSYIINSESPLDALVKVTQDFPKYSASLVTKNYSEEFYAEHGANREKFLPSGMNLLFFNGLQMDARKMDAFSLLDQLRRERKLISSFQSLGLTSRDAISILSHSAIAEAQGDADTQRYDWRDETEGGHVIIWLNDIEKDKRYQDWPHGLYSLLQRGYPGQIPSVRKDIHNAIVPIDFTNPKDLTMVVDYIQDIIKRKVPCRWGLVPVTSSANAAEQAVVVYYVAETYGLGALVDYLQSSLKAKKTTSPNPKIFADVAEKFKDRTKKGPLTLEEALAFDPYKERTSDSQKYLARLGASGTTPIFINGVPIKKDDEWLTTLSQRVTLDLRWVQRAVFEEVIAEDTWIPSQFLSTASLRRNPLIIPEDPKDIKLYNLANVYEGEESLLESELPTVPASKDADSELWTQLLVVGDFNSNTGFKLALDAVEFRKEHENLEVVLVHNGDASSRASRLLANWKGAHWTANKLPELIESLQTLETSTDSSTKVSWPDTLPLCKKLGLSKGQNGLVINGRRLGPIPESVAFSVDDFSTLLDFEATKRILPAAKAIVDLNLTDKLKRAADTAKLCSLLAVSTVSDMPEGIFELPPPVRTALFDSWTGEHTSLSTGDIATASIQIIGSIDPATEVAQRWVPILKVLSELDGVYLKLFLNPKEKLQELPIKRFYRYVLESKPSFTNDGSLQKLGARFSSVPKKALLTAGMDVPASWLVAPKESVHDLDNIKLSTLSAGSNVDAIYELENILIEGHSREVAQGAPPRGAQLVLSTAKDPNFADTIIMSNLGYFQFKANPGFYNISLKPGSSQRIFHIDSVGALGYNPQPGDESTEVTLLSFQGVTLFPRISRKPGMDNEDVLQEAGSGGSDIISQGAGLVDGLLQKAGLKHTKPGNYLSEAIQRGAGLLKGLGRLANTKSKAGTQAEINIFSVASGHLYERMLNIMMVSVMKHTNHTVKFWFIEQFLSPSFKSFLPTMAEEYGFTYEMVTYKWPHWLRAQKEKQREIWGYKILFLDVLFPLDLDKVIFVDADQIVRTDMYELVTHDLQGAPYGFTPMCDSRTEMEGFRFWKQGYWKNFLRGLPYHISALYVVDLKRFRQMAAGDRLRQQYHQLSADPNSLSNLDQDLPNNMQMVLPIHSLPQEWLWCETWCSDESLKDAKTIDLCNNPQTKEPKLDRARRQVPEWTEYDEEIAALARRKRGEEAPRGSVQESEQNSADGVGEEQTADAGSSARSRDEL
ncbi:hypothetical protein EJ06DRAFT_574492 [Trichodelitschia bisporula]|uniref:UDP-glucose:glycoprotein glucosyltransferase n=1 Tax=Trichodelitschia bisporula TaxID=703511 RepID=A0A6G1I2Y0_9PEZI|nr:hypothetical protein EJ06DRAFT_574492 [Trichodelitschia bisporula]